MTDCRQPILDLLPGYHYPDREFAGRIVDQKLVNYDESRVPQFTLPSPLRREDGSMVDTAFDWANGQRQRILEMLAREMYGKILPRPDSTSSEILAQKDDALDGTAIRKEIRLHFGMHDGRSYHFDMLLYIPKNAPRPVPAFVGLNFKGNHNCTDEQIMPTGLKASPQPQLTAEEKEMQIGRWHFREAVKRGYACATACYQDIFPDRADGWDQSALTLFEDNLSGFSGAHEKYTAIGVWAWGLSRMLDYLETEPLVDSSRTAVHGHSRLGKTALWAGACDRRFRLVISNDSGCGGAALARRWFGELYIVMHNVFPHWLVKGFAKYHAQVEKLPFDQHFLLSLIAPRPLAVASASEDLWADPRGEFLSALNTREVYRLFGSQGLPDDNFPEPDGKITGDVSYHLRRGPHQQNAFDWEHYLEIADKVLR